MSLPGPRFTYQDYRLMPEDRRYEVLDGELLVTPAPEVYHQTISMRLSIRVGGSWRQATWAGCWRPLQM